MFQEENLICYQNLQGFSLFANIIHIIYMLIISRASLGMDLIWS